MLKHLIILISFFAGTYMISLTTPPDWSQKLEDFKLFPKNSSSWPPHRVCSVNFSDIVVQAGTYLNESAVSCEPAVSWKANKSDLYCLYMAGTSKMFPINLQLTTSQSYLHVPLKHQWVQWAVGNIPGKKIHKGDVLKHYVPPTTPTDGVTRDYIVLVFKQNGPIKYEDMKIELYCWHGHEVTYVEKFRQHYGMRPAICANYFHLKSGHVVVEEKESSDSKSIILVT